MRRIRVFVCLLHLLLSFLCLGVGALSGPPVRIGVFHCTAPTPRACFVPNIELLIGMWFDVIGPRGILGRPVEQVVTQISGSLLADEDEMEAATLDLLAQGIDFVVWPVATNTIAKGAALLDARGIPSVAGGTVDGRIYRCDSRSWCSVACDCPDGVKPPDYVRRRRFDFLHTPSNVDEAYLREWVALMRLKHASTLAVVRVDNIFFRSIEESLHRLSRDYRLELVHSSLAPFTSTTDSSVSFETALDALREVMALRPDGLALLMFDCKPWTDALQALDYMPPSLLAVNCIDNSAIDPFIERNFVSGPAQWDSRLSSSAYTELLTDPWALYGVPALTNDIDVDTVATHANGGSSSGSSGIITEEAEERDVLGTPGRPSSAQLFVQQWQRAYNSTLIPGYAYAEFIGSFEMLHAAIVLANSTDGLLVNAQLTDLSQPSFYGLMETNRFGYNEHKPMLILQQDLQGTLQIVAPIQHATADFIYPAPTWRERVYRQQLFALPVEQVFVGLVCFCSFVTLVLLGFVVLRWSHPLLRATGGPAYLTIGIGCLAGVAAILTWTVENNAAKCAARVWLVSIAFHAVLQPLLFATRKVHRIHSAARSLRSPSAKTSANVRGRLLLMRLLAAIPPLAFNFALGLPAMKPYLEAGVDVLRPGTSAYTLCMPVDAGRFIVFLALHCIYGGLLLLLTCVYAVRIRSLPPAYHDANALARAVYLFALSVLCISITQAVLGDGGAQHSVAVLSFALRSSGMLLGYLSCVVLLIGSRIPLCTRIRAQTFLSDVFTSPSPLNGHHRSRHQQLDDNHQLQPLSQRYPGEEADVELTIPDNGINPPRGVGAVSAPPARNADALGNTPRHGPGIGNGLFAFHRRGGSDNGGDGGGGGRGRTLGGGAAGAQTGAESGLAAATMAVAVALGQHHPAHPALRAGSPRLPFASFPGAIASHLSTPALQLRPRHMGQGHDHHRDDFDDTAAAADNDDEHAEQTLSAIGEGGSGSEGQARGRVVPHVRLHFNAPDLAAPLAAAGMATTAASTDRCTHRSSGSGGLHTTPHTPPSFETREQQRRTRSRTQLSMIGLGGAELSPSAPMDSDYLNERGAPGCIVSDYDSDPSPHAHPLHVTHASWSAAAAAAGSPLASAGAESKSSAVADSVAASAGSLAAAPAVNTTTALVADSAPLADVDAATATTPSTAAPAAAAAAASEAAAPLPFALMAPDEQEGSHLWDPPPSRATSILH